MDNTDWLDTWDAKIDAWESTVTAGVVAHLNRQERVVIEKLTGRKVRERYEPDGSHLCWVPLDEKAAATAAARSAAAQRAWLTRRGLLSAVVPATPSMSAPAPIVAPAPQVSSPAPNVPSTPHVPSAPAARGVSSTLSQAQLSARAQKAWATRRAKQGLPAAPPPAAVGVLHQVAQTTPPPPPAPHIPAATPAVSSTPAPSHPFASTLAGMGAASTWHQHSNRRSKWIGNDPARREFASIAAEWIGDYGTVNNQQYIPIKDAANALAGKSRGKIASKAAERKARVLMDAAANGPKQPNLYRGVAYNDAELARLQVGATFTEPLAAWSGNRGISLGYGSLRTRGQRYATNPRKNIVLYELDDAHAVSISPMSSSSTPAYFQGEEHLASGQYEITSITTSKERPPWMSPSGPTPGPQTHTVTIVKIKQIARGFDPNQPGTLIKAAPADIELPGLDQPLLAGIRFTSADWDHADPAAVAEMLLGWIDEDDQPAVDEMKAFLGDWVGERKIDLSTIFDPRAWIKALLADAFDWLFGITKDFGNYSLGGIAGARRFNPDDAKIRKTIEAQAERFANTVQTTASTLELTLADGEANGETVDQLADRVRRVFDLARTGRAPMIAATEVSNAANAAAMAAAMQSGLDLDKTWWTRRDERVRTAHRDVHGHRKSLDEPFMVGGVPMMFPGDPTAPPHLTINCFPAETLVAGPHPVSGTKRFYSGPMITVRTATGHKLTGTPNHPVFTTRGWIPLNAVEEGDNLISCSFADAPGLVRPQDVEAVPAPISEIHDALSRSGVSQRVRGGLMDFHGDGMNGEIDVVSVDRELSDRVKTSIDQPVADFAFPLADGRPTLESAMSVRTLGAVDLIGAALPAADSGMSGRSEAGSFRGSQLRHPDSVGVADGTGFDARLKQSKADRPPTDAEIASDGLLALPGVVALAQVVDVQVEAFQGPVFNLENQYGWYTANGLVVHNCRCALKLSPAIRPVKWAWIGDVR